MKIAVTCKGPTLDDSVESRFGRSPYFLIIDPETLALEPFPNPNLIQGGGTGPQTAKALADKAVSVILTGNCGPNALHAFGAAGIEVVYGVSGTARQAVEAYRSDAASRSSVPTVPGGSPLPQGQSNRRNEQFATGARKDRSRLKQIRHGQPAHLSRPRLRSQQPSSGGEIEHLKSRLNQLKGQLDFINRRLGAFEGRESSAAVAVVDPGKCIGCGLCEDICPRQAISLRSFAGTERPKLQRRL
ncbi:MAG: NifB/NifX family molybdenum-iron cluster-binding protein [Syntrophobacteria bacterium]